MKTLIIAAALISAPAFADFSAWAPTNEGGRIYITDAKCKLVKNTDTMAALLVAASGETLRGCWAIYRYDHSKVQVVWEDDRKIWTYDANNFNKTEGLTK